jgi:hypothetical protein
MTWHEKLTCDKVRLTLGQERLYIAHVIPYTGPEVNTQKSEYMAVSHHQNAGQNWNVLIANKSAENVTQFKYLETVTK